MPKYQLSDPKGGTFEFTSDKELSRDDLLRKADHLFNRPSPTLRTDAGEPEPGSDISLVRSAFREAPAIAGASLLPEAVPLAGPASMAARAGLSVAGEMMGATIGNVGTDAAPPSGFESAARGALAGGTQVAVDAAGKLLFTQLGQEEVGNALRVISGTRGIPRALTPEMAAGEQKLSGQLIKDGLPGAYGKIKKETRRMFAVERNFGRAVPPRPMPDNVVKSAQDALDALGPPGQSLVPEIESRARKVLDRIIDRGTPKATKSKVLDLEGNPNVSTTPPKPVTYNELLSWESDLREVLPQFQGRMHPNTESKGTLQNIYERIQRELDSMGRGLPVQKARQNAKDFFRTTVAPFRDAADSIAKDSVGPSDITDTLTRDPDRFLALMPHLTPDTQRVVRSSWFNSAIQRSTNRDLGSFSTDEFLKHWNSLSPLVQRQLSGSNGGAITDLMQEANRLSRKSAMISTATRVGGTGAAGVSMYQGLRELNDGNIEKGTALLFGGAVAPLVLPTMLADRRTIQLWRQGLRVPAGTNIARRFGSQIAQTLSHAIGAYTALTEPQGAQELTPALPPGS